ncbi:hypothetical protein ABTG32_17980, partial [Acinetobacter baumannii]
AHYSRNDELIARLPKRDMILFRLKGRNQAAEAMKILTINFGGIGDEILFLPTLASIRAIYPHARISLLLEPRSRSFEQVTDLVDEILT